MRICYIEKRFKPASMELIWQANEIIEEYQAAGYDLTLRQLYYQFVSRDLIPNTDRSYKRLGSVVNDGRLAGEIDWDVMVDRTRNLRSHSHWETPGDIIDSAARSYAVDMWKNQSYRPEVWIEKDALLGVIEGVCTDNDVPFFSCRGYTSQSEMWRAARRFRRYSQEGHVPVVIHLGDHDPSGMDMSRDILDRIRCTFGVNIDFERIALNMNQIDQYDPPPNPAKITDSRAKRYMLKYGNESWELDALEPQVMGRLITEQLDILRNQEQWDDDSRKAENERAELIHIAANWGAVIEKFGLDSDE
jgi:hypothetical protein